ncbi:MAG: phosphoheptose isomerase [Acidobacteria bacterium]|jgi:phosphoheptose isomerase|nr:phosphoheptose isomerase [Acidobacteriota bacterium]
MLVPGRDVVTRFGALPSDAVARAGRLLAESASVIATVGQRDLGPLVRSADAIVASLSTGGRVLVFGNGGSAAESQHFAAELAGRFERDRAPLPAIALTTDTSILTAAGNDYGFDKVFSRQVEALGRSGDVAMAISTSGVSPNVLAGARAARSLGLVTIGLTGRDGGVLGREVDVHVNVPHASTARVQEAQLAILHVICDLVEGALEAA